MNDLTLCRETDEVLQPIDSYFQILLDGLHRARALFEKIHSFEDIEIYLLRGTGLSSETYRCYLVAVKQFYEFTDGLNPLQVTPGHIEAFYDHLVRRVRRNTASAMILGLKYFFKCITSRVPGFINPFDIMEPALLKKLTRKTKGNRTKKTLTPAEVKCLLAWLSKDVSVIGLANYAIVFTLVTSGLRASELLQLRWKDLELLEGMWTARFIGKGGKEAEQELFTPAVETCRLYFTTQFNRNPKSEDALFWDYRIKNPHVFTRSGLLKRIQRIGQAAREEGIITRPLTFSTHLFRRTYATCLYKSGMGIRAIQQKTRHESVEVLMRHYIYDRDPASPYFEKMLKEME